MGVRMAGVREDRAFRARILLRYDPDTLDGKEWRGNRSSALIYAYLFGSPLFATGDN